MAVELVTGYAGQSHVGADEARKVIRSLAGKGNYWCEAAPTLSMTDSNTFHTAAFYAVCGGGVFRIEATDLTVDNGAQSVKRNDIVCVEYDKDTSTGIESAQLVVVKGTPGTTATDPTLTTGDLVSGCTKAQFALARIALDGITVGTPVLLLDRLPTLDSVSQVLWSGTWTSGSITVHGLETGQRVDMVADGVVHMYGSVFATQVVAGCCFSAKGIENNNTYLGYYLFSADRSGDTLTMRRCEFYSPGQDVDYTGKPVNEIVLLP